jgi:hypothetical protein
MVNNEYKKREKLNMKKKRKAKTTGVRMRYNYDFSLRHSERLHLSSLLVSINNLR